MIEKDVRHPTSNPIRLALIRGLLVGSAVTTASPISLRSLAATCGCGSAPTVPCAVIAGLVVGVVVALATGLELRITRRSGPPLSLAACALCGVAIQVAMMLTLLAASAQAVYLAGAISTNSVQGGFEALAALRNEAEKNAGDALTTYATAALPFALFGFARLWWFPGFWIPGLFVSLGTPLTLILAQPTVYYPFHPWDEFSPLLLQVETVGAILVIGVALPILWRLGDSLLRVVGTVPDPLGRGVE